MALLLWLIWPILVLAVDQSKFRTCDVEESLDEWIILPVPWWSDCIAEHDGCYIYIHTGTICILHEKTVGWFLWGLYSIILLMDWMSKVYRQVDDRNISMVSRSTRSTSHRKTVAAQVNKPLSAGVSGLTPRTFRRVFRGVPRGNTLSMQIEYQ